MPRFAPRIDPIKKTEQLEKRKKALEHAVKNELPVERLNKLADKYRLAQLALLKAKIHEIKERNFQRKSHMLTIEKIEYERLFWERKSFELIIEEIKGNVITLRGDLPPRGN